jgi:hypothetical protein
MKPDRSAAQSISRTATPRGSARVTLACALVFAATCCASLPSAHAATTTRTFRGDTVETVRFALAPVSGNLRFAANRVNVWTDSGIQRLALDGDVRITLAGQEFQATRATLWLWRLSGSANAGTWQVFAYLENVENPAADVAVTIKADKLPIRAVISSAQPVTMAADLLTRSAPTDSAWLTFNTTASAALADAIEANAGRPTAAQKAAAAIAESEGQLLATRAGPSRTSPGRTANLPPRPAIYDEKAVAAMLEASGLGPRKSAIATRDTAPKEGQETPPSTSTDRRAASGGARPPAGSQRRADPRAAGTQAAPSTAAATGASSSGASTTTANATESTRSAQTAATPAATATPATTAAAPRPDAPRVDSPDGIFRTTGSIGISAGGYTIQSGADENTIIASDGIVVQYSDASTGRTLEMTAQRAVVFLSPGPLSQISRLDASNVRGIYLEGDVVASDGKISVRGPKVYYDLQANKAVMLDSVFWTYDQKRSLPLYVRAKTIRQESKDQFSAEQARLSTTAFFDPDLSIGARSVVITRSDVQPSGDGSGSGGGTGGSSGEGGVLSDITSGIGGLGGTDQADSPSGVTADMRGITLRAYGLPIAWAPRFTGDPGNAPIKDVRLEDSNSSGLAAKVRWNLYGLLGRKRPDNLSIDVLTDYYADRGFAGGTRLNWQNPNSQGELFAYGVFDDRGTDVLRPGSKIDRQGGGRGMILGDNRWRIDDHWTLFTEAAYIGDPAFVDGFVENLGAERREFATQMLATRREDNTLLTFQAKTSLNDFVANEYLLQSQGYSVQKLPEVTYTRLNDDLFAETSPGLLTWSQEYRVGILGMQFDEAIAKERGFLNDSLAQRTFGITGQQRIADRLRAEGYRESDVTRADTRHEFMSQLHAGPVNVTPFVVGRLTAYDSDFGSYAKGEDDQLRVWGAAGVRVSTTIQKVDDTVQSRFFDMSRVRHIIEPGVTLWTAGSNREGSTLPVYDQAVEALTEGTQTRIGIHQTWQTMRGEPGKQRSVDVFRLDTDYVVASKDADRRSPIGRWYESRPENSETGEFFLTDAAWQATDTLAFTASNVYDFEANQPARTSVGMLLEQGQDFSTFMEYRFINSQDSQFFDVGGQYKVSEKYHLGALTSYSAKTGTFQDFSCNLQRRSASVVFGVDVSYNAVTGKTGLGFLLRPIGTGGGGLGSRSISGRE